MATQTFPAGAAPRVVVSDCRGDLEIAIWDERTIVVECDGPIDQLVQGDEALTIQGALDDLRLRVPADAEIVAERVRGDVEARGMPSLALSEVAGDVELADIAGAARIETVGGAVEIHGAGSVALAGRAGGDVEIHGAGVVEIEQVDGDLDVSDGQSVVVGSVGGDCDV